jgi:anti-anti-sigma factor
MPTQITQIEDNESNRTVLRVSGSLTLEDARLIERLCIEIKGETQRRIVLDLADVDFLDSESASVLTRLQEEFGVEVEGMQFVVQSAIDLAERSEHGR